MTWQIAITLNIIISSVTILVQRQLLKDLKSQPIVYAILVQFFTGAFIAIAALIFPEPKVFSFFTLLPNIFLAIILYTVANILIYQALKTTQASIFTIIFSARVFFTILASTLLLSESLSSTQLLGASAMFIGIIIANLQSSKIKIGKAEATVFLAAALIGFANTNDRFILQNLPLYFYTSISFLGPSLLIGAIYPQHAKAALRFTKHKVFPKLILLSFLYTLAALTFFLSLKLTDNSSTVASISLASVIVTVLLAALFLNEKKQLLQKLFAASLSIIGLLLLIN